MPGGTNTPLDKVLLQAPGVTQDSAASGLLHVRNEHANVSYRFNGILLPDGVSGFGQVLESSFIGSMSLFTGVLPAQYGLRTAAVVDITTRVPNSPGAGSVGVYGGSHEQITPCGRVRRRHRQHRIFCGRALLGQRHGPREYDARLAGHS